MRRTKEEAEQTRQHILKAAIVVMNNRGISSTRFEDIAVEADVTRGAIYHYFKSKNEIILAIHDNMKKQMMELFEKYISADIDPVISLKNGLKAVFTRFEDDKNYREIEQLFLKAEFASLLKDDKELCKLFEKNKKETICDMLELVKRGQEAGSLRRDIQMENLGFAIIAFYIGFITASFMGKGELGGAGLIDEYIDVLLHGILK
jgi:TetR/AcrR family acrAB operon transcriptional repressor